MVLLRESIMKQQLLKEIELGSKNALIKKRIITHYIYNGSSTITDLSKELDLSIPTVTKFIGEMYEDGYINDYGKLETSGGRHPSLYGLNPESGYFIGVDIKRFAVGIGVLMAENDGGHCDEAFLQNGEMQAFPEEYADGMFNLIIVGELQAP